MYYGRCQTIMIIDNLTNCEELETLKRNHLKVDICEVNHIFIYRK